MYAKLDKIRDDLKKAVAKRDAANAKVKRLEEKLKEEENLQIVSDVTSYNLTPEQLAQFLQLVKDGKLQDLLRGEIAMPVPGSGTEETDQKVNFDAIEKEEDFLNEE